MRDSVEAVGTTRALRAIDIVPLSSGRLTTLSVEAGRAVEAGTVIATLSEEIERAQLAEAEAKLSDATLALERAQALRSSNTVSQATLQAALVAVATAQAGVDQARQKLEDRTIIAPFAGVLGLSGVDVGARVTEQTVLTTLDDISAVDVEFSLSEALIGKIVPGLSVEARAAAFVDRIFTGTVVSIDSRIDPASRAFRVRARLPNGDHALPSGMFMSVRVVFSERETLAIPDEAVVLQAGEAVAFVIVDDKAVRRAIETGERRDGMVEILSGIAEGEEVVVRGTQRLRDGADIRRAGAGAQQG